MTKIDGRCVHYEASGREQAVAGDVILMAAGRGPNTAGLNLKKLGLRINRSAIAVDEHMQTSVPGIYAIGDVNGQSMLAHTASAEARAAVSTPPGR